jgi:type II secretory pathway component GspD/PulD (secretin)
VAYLSDIPGIGRLFTKTETHTNFNRMLVIVRPRL